MSKKISESRDAFECEVLISIFISHLFRSLSHHRKNLKAYFPVSDTSDKLFLFLNVPNKFSTIFLCKYGIKPSVFLKRELLLNMSAVTSHLTLNFKQF